MRASARFPLILAANRDEDFDRPTLPASFWPDAPDVLGGRDGLQGGTWLAISRSGRFGAVTNLRGALHDPRKRSRGELVSNFVRGNASPRQYIDDVAARTDQYAGFHLIVGDVRGEVFEESGGKPPHSITGIHALSNAAVGEEWPKVGIAEDEMRRLVTVSDVDELIAEALQFLRVPRGTTRAQSEIFIVSDRHGTRSSTVIVASRDSIHFVEQSFAAGGVPDGPPRSHTCRYS